MKILVTGYNGQLGYDVVHEGRKHDLEMIGITIEDLDITSADEVTKYIHDLRPEAIIHCAAYTAVDQAEEDRETAWDVNVNGTKYLAEAAKSIGAKFIYISTDYVYEGIGDQPYTEDSKISPQSYYGLTKYEGEQVVQNLLADSFIVRISWVFGINGNNFIKTMLRLAETHNELKVVSDQIGSPTYTHDLAKLLIDMVQTNKFGVYQVTNDGYCSWADFAKKIFELAGCSVKVEGITSEEYPTLAVRPKNSRMSKQKLIANGFEPLPHWEKALTHYINELKQEVQNGR